MAEAGLPPPAGSPRDALEHGGHRGTRAIQRMVEFAPSTGGLALWVRHHDLPDGGGDADRPIVSTDGHTVYYGAGFEALGIAAQVGLVAHEVLHIALRHPQRHAALRRLLGDVDRQLFNICADAIVNSTLAHLSWLELSTSAVLLDRLLASAVGLDQSVEKSLLEWDLERLYRAIDDRRSRDEHDGRQSQDGRRQGGSTDASAAGAAARSTADHDAARQGGARGDGPRSARVRALGADSHADLLPGVDCDTPPEAEAEQAREWSERILRAHAGDAEYSMLRTLIADLPTIRTPWEQLLRTRLARSLASRPGPSWSRPARSYIANQGRAGPHRRMPWEPGYGTTTTVPRLAVIVDVSGSIDDALLQRFAREIEAITRRHEAGLVLVVGDLRVTRVVRLEPGRSDLRGIEFNGGGGTDFTPLLEEADRHRPDIGVVLTDLDGPARFRPRWPVIWAVPQSHATSVPPLPPFGRVLELR